MSPPEPDRPEPGHATPGRPAQGHAARSEHPRAGHARGGRQRPGPTSALAPSPAPLMPVPDTDGSARSAPAGRRQHHRTAVPAPGEELVYLSGRVPRALRDELHIRAIHDGRPVVELLREAIRAYLDQGQGAGSRTPSRGPERGDGSSR